MFNNAQNLAIRDTVIHNAGRDMTIIHIHNEPRPVRAPFPYVISSDNLRGSTIIASFKLKHSIPMAQFIFGDYYASLHSFGTHVYLWNACSPK